MRGGFAADFSFAVTLACRDLKNRFLAKFHCVACDAMKFRGVAVESLIRPSTFGLKAELEIQRVSNLGVVVAGDVSPVHQITRGFRYGGVSSRLCLHSPPLVTLPQQFLYFLPLPQGQGSLRPTLASARLGAFFSGSELPWVAEVGSATCLRSTGLATTVK